MCIVRWASLNTAGLKWQMGVYSAGSVCMKAYLGPEQELDWSEPDSEPESFTASPWAEFIKG